MAIPIGARCGQCENFVSPCDCKLVAGRIFESGHCTLFKAATAGPFGEPASRLYLTKARDAIAEVLTRFFGEEAPRIAADVLRHVKKSAHPVWAGKLAKVSDHTDPDAHGVKPIEDPHRTREISAAVAAALASINFHRWSDLAKEISPYLEEAALRTVEDTLAEVHASLTPAETEAVKAAVTTWAKERAAELVGQRRIAGGLAPDTSADKDITDSTERMIAEPVRRAIAERSTVAELTTALRESPAFSSSRAKRIADTETKTALHRATMLGFKASGRVKGSYWVTAHDERVESVCLTNELASPVRLGHPFPSGHTAPLAHPNCLPGVMRVKSPPIRATSERWYNGDLVVINTAAGNELSCTPNHPILTAKGWVPAHALNKGDHVISYCGPNGNAFGGLDHKDMPPSIHDVTEAFGRTLQVQSRPVVISSVDFHGDGKGSEVAIIRSDCLLWDDIEAALTEHSFEREVIMAGMTGQSHSGCSSSQPSVERDSASFSGGVCRGKLGQALGRSHSGPFEPLGLTLIPHVNAEAKQTPSDGQAAHSESYRELIFRDPALVEASEFVEIDGKSSSLAGARTDRNAAAAEQPEKVSERYPGFLRDEYTALAGKVFADEVINISRCVFEGHVYNLETVTGWYIAEGIVTHNCRCYLIPWM